MLYRILWKNTLWCTHFRFFNVVAFDLRVSVFQGPSRWSANPVTSSVIGKTVMTIRKTSIKLPNFTGLSICELPCYCWLFSSHQPQPTNRTRWIPQRIQTLCPSRLPYPSAVLNAESTYEIQTLIFTSSLLTDPITSSVFGKRGIRGAISIFGLM